MCIHLHPSPKVSTLQSHVQAEEDGEGSDVGDGENSMQGETVAQEHHGRAPWDGPHELDDLVGNRCEKDPSERLIIWVNEPNFNGCWHSFFFPVVFPQQRKLMGSSAQNISGVHWCRRRVRLNRVPEKVPDKVWEALVQSQVRINRVPKVREKVLGGFGAEPGQGRPWCRARSSSTGFRRRFRREKVPGSHGAKPSQVQRVPEKVSEKVPEKVLRKICKNKTLRLLGIPPKLVYFNILGIIIPTDFHIFQRGRSTTNQLLFQL